MSRHPRACRSSLASVILLVASTGATARGGPQQVSPNGARQEIVFIKSDGSPLATPRPSTYLAGIQPDGSGERKVGLEIVDSLQEIQIARRAPTAVYMRATIAPNGNYGPTDDLVVVDTLTGQSRVTVQLPHGTAISGLSADGATIVYAQTDRSDPDYGCCESGLVAFNLRTKAKAVLKTAFTPRTKTSPVHPGRYSAGKMRLSPDGAWLSVGRTFYKTFPRAALLIHRPTGSIVQLGAGSDGSSITDISKDTVLFEVSDSAREGAIDLYRYDLTRKTEQLVVKGGHTGKLSPDGGRVAYFADGPKRGPFPTQNLWVTDQSRPPRLIASDIAGDFSWSPDSMSLVYTRMPEDRSKPGFESVWIATVDGAPDRRIASGNFNAPSRPVWVAY